MEKKEYYIGIDAGTNSVGWAVTDPSYQVVKRNGKALWGVRLFEDGSTAEKRRMARAARRSGDRKTVRQALLRELFSEEIASVDASFYQRLDESQFWEEDKKVPGRYCLFHDPKFNDRDYHQAYPTIYHLRQELMTNAEPHDVRLVYLALAHLIKHRGHFFAQMSPTDTQPDFQTSWDALKEDLWDLMEMNIECTDMEKLQQILQEKMPVRDKGKELKRLITVSNAPDQPAFTCIFDLLSGKTTDVAKSFGIHLEGDDKNALKVSFAGEDMSDEEKLTLYHTYLEDHLQILIDLKAIYDWGILVGILHGAATISEAKIRSFEKHAGDLARLQKLVKGQFPGKYNEVFRWMRKGLNNYCAYTGHYDRRNAAYVKAAHRCTQEEFFKFLKDLLKDSTDADAQAVLTELELGTFLPLQHSKENSVIPYQMNLREMQLILNNAEGYLPFLKEVDADGISVRAKIESLLTFRVPYYVGPLDNTNAKPGTHWAVKREPGTAVRPCNFDRVVDKEASAEGFMNQLTNTCTYLIGESVLPKDSIVYSRFMALNELNNVTIYGERLPVEVKQKAFEQLFLQRPQVRRKALETFLRTEGLLKKGEESAIGGIDGDFKASLKVEIRLRDIFADKLPSMDQMDKMILAVLLLKQEPEMLRSRICRICPDITDSQLKRVCKLPCSGWGRFSRKFLTELTAELPDHPGETVSILDALWLTQKNLMQLLAGDQPFKALVDGHNAELMEDTKLDYRAVEKLSAPPAVRRSVWQTLRIVQEITRIMGGAPAKIFVEMARGSDGSGRTISRKKQLGDCYRAMGEDSAVLAKELENYEDPRLRQDKLYLYFTQMGRCMYTGQPIDLAALLNDTGNQLYDIDHIYPRSRVKDDSLDNRVLVCKKANQDKSDVYPIQSAIRKAQMGFWTYLFDHKLISRTKLERLTRATPFSEEELAGFINRQLVETRQSTKVLAQILSQALPESRIVYVKAGNVSDFRQLFDLVKVRDLNDLHHAKDAYLNIVVGNVYDVKFTSNPRNFLRSGESYSMKAEVLFKYPVRRGATVAWSEHSIDSVKKQYRRNNIFVTRLALRRNSGQNGGLYDQNPKSGGAIPRKGSDPRLANTERYGGYSGDTGAYMILVEHGPEKKRIRSLEPVYLRFAGRVEANAGYLEQYCQEELKLTAPRIIIPEIRFNTLMECRGFRFWMTGRTGTHDMKGIQAFQMVLSPEEERYLKKVLKASERQKASKGAWEISEERDRISSAENEHLYGVFMDKMNVPMYHNRPASQEKVLINGKEKFQTLSLTEQCHVLCQILSLFRGGGIADLNLIGGKAGGKIAFARNVKDDFKIIYQSVTGFYSHEDRRLK